MRKVLSKLGDLVMAPGYWLDDHGHEGAAEAYSLVAIPLVLVAAATVALIITLVV